MILFDDFLARLKSILNSRFIPIVFIYCLLFAILVIRLFNLQISQNASYLDADEATSTTVRELKSTRGKILDCNGVLLAYNELSYTITIQDDPALKTNEDINRVIYTLIKILDDNNTELETSFFIELDDDGNLQFTNRGDALLSFKRDVFSLKTIDDLTEEMVEADADKVYEFLRTGDGFEGYNFTKMYEISDEYELKDALRIMQVRYQMMLNKYSRYTPIIIASNVSDDIVAAVNEYSSDMPGVNILEQSHRVYKDSEYFSHILGYTGTVTDDDIKKYNTDSDNPVYSPTDQIGKTGIEYSMEEYLRGTKGYENVKLNSKSQVTQILETVEPSAGNDLYLTIDATLQEACYKLLEKELASILLSKIINVKSIDLGDKADSKDIQIPVYDVYFALIDNYLIDTNHFSATDASDSEKKAYDAYEEQLNVVLSDIKAQLAKDNNTLPGKLDDDMNTYLDYIYSYLKNNGVIINDSIDKSDDNYKKFSNKKMNLAHFLQYAFSKDWINLKSLSIEDSSFYSADELYNMLVDYIIDRLKTDTEFGHYIYKILVYNDKLSGNRLGMIMYDQGFFKEDESTYNNLSSGSITAYSFFTDKIKKLEITPGDLGLDPCSGSVVITDPNTGKVKALVSYPSYDNNMLANSINAKYYSSLLNKNSDVLVNRATQTLSAPGSTFKICSAIAGLEEGVISPSTTIYDKHEYTKVKGSSPKCTGYHGSINAAVAIEVSCNYFFFDVGYRLSLDGSGNYDSAKGLKQLDKYAKMLGYGSKSGIEISEYEPQTSDTDSIRSAIGQGTNAFAPVQIARYMTTIATSGTVYNLTLVDKIVSVDNKVILNNKKAEVASTAKVSSSTWDCVHEGLRLVVNGPQSGIDEYFDGLKQKVAGKTGTAQQISTRANHALFMSYAPYEKPELTVTCVIPFGYTSHNAAELASNIYKYYFEAEDSEKLLNSDVKSESAQTGYQD